VVDISATRARFQDTKELDVPPAGLEEFKQEFKISWEIAVEQRSVRIRCFISQMTTTPNNPISFFFVGTILKNSYP
jgi:hypothetical protein